MDPTTQNFLPADATWSGVVILIAAGLFLAAIVIGIVARLVMPEKYAQHGEVKPAPIAERAKPHGFDVLPPESH
jgi:hypothetical protein